MTLAIEWYVDAADPGFGSVDVGSTATVSGGWQTFRDWLAAIESAVQAAGVDYTVGYSAALDRVVLSKTSGTDAGFEWASDSMAKLLGWEAFDDTATAASVHTALNAPGGLIQLLGWELLGAEPGRKVQREDWGFGRARNGSFGSGIEWEFGITTTFEAARRWHEGPCSTGRVRLGPLAASSALTSSNLSGYLEGSWLELRRPDTNLPTGAFAVTRARLFAGAAPTSSGIFAPLARGYSLAMYAQVDGLPYTFSELAMGLTDESATLVVSERDGITNRIDRERGSLGGSQLRLGVSLATPFEAPTLTARLEADVAYNATTFTVDDTTGWPSSGTLYVGHEVCTYSGTTSTTFTGITRGSPAYAYRTTAPLGWATVSNRPLRWAGRVVRLWAAMVDAYGRRRTDADVQLWSGEIAATPAYDSGVYWLDCEDLAVRLTRPVGGETEANLAPESRWYGLQRGPMVGIPKTAYARYRVTGPSSYEVDGAVEIASLLFDDSEPPGTSDYAWVAYGYMLDALIEYARAQTVGSGYDLFEPWGPQLEKDGSVWKLKLRTKASGGFVGDGSWEIGPIVLTDGTLWPGFDRAVIFSENTTYKVNNPSQLSYRELVTETGLDGTSLDSITVYQTETLASLSGQDWSEPGVIAIEGADGIEIASYREVLADSFAPGRYHLGGVTRAQSGSLPADVTEPGGSVYQYLAMTGTAGEQIGALLQSSGYGDRGSLDTLALGYALGSDLVDEDGLTESGPGALLVTTTALKPGSSLVEHFGGMLASQGYSIAPVRGASNERLLGVRSFIPFGETEGSITDADLRSDKGPEIHEVNPAPNTIELKPADLAGMERRSTRILLSEARLAEGVREASYTLPATLSPFASVLLRAWGTSAIAMRRNTIVYQSGVTPAEDWQPGQVRAVSVSHPATGTISGKGAILQVSRKFDGQCEIAFAVRTDGIQVGTLCPSGRVTAIASATLTVTSTAGLVVGEFVRVYQAGSASNTSNVEIKSVGVGSVELDSVPAWLTSGAVATGAVWITYPEQSACSTRQRSYVHMEDGSVWL